MSIIHQCNVTHNSHVLSGTTYMLESVVLMLANFTFVIILYKCRLHLNWKISIFILSLSISDLFSGFALFALSVSMYFYYCTVPSWIEGGIQLACSFSILTSVLNYTSLFFVQYLAVRRPIFYQTRCTHSNFVKILTLQYTFVMSFEIWKGFMLTNADDVKWFSYFEVTMMGFSLVFNIVTYSYVLHVVGKRQTMAAVKTGNEQLLQSISVPNDFKTFFSKMYWRNLLSTLINDYWGVTSAGIQLAIYIVTFVPFWGIEIHITVFGSNDGVYDIYQCQMTMCHFGVFIWFLRGCIDPLIHVVRDPKLHVLNKYRKSLLTKNSTASFQVNKNRTSSTIPTVSGSVKMCEL